MSSLERYFDRFRSNIIGIDQEFESPFGPKKIVYADWTASGRMYRPIEEKINQDIAPFVANTHTESTFTGCVMTEAYHKARQIIKDHVNATEHDILISSNSGMTGVINKFQRILGFKIHEKYRDRLDIPKEQRPIVFVTHMEHHSNQTSWLETIAEVQLIGATEDGLVDLADLQSRLRSADKNRLKIAAVTSCSNVTGIFTPYHQIAKLMHQFGGLCFVDFACSAPYIDIDMHPSDPEEKLDAVYFSPHKFLGGPSSSGILIFCSQLYKNKVPDVSGGGTVDWTNPWGEHKYLDEIEAREDGGTPSFIQTIRVALAMQLKNEMSVDKIHDREQELLKTVWSKMIGIKNLHVLADHLKDRLPVISFYIDDLHYNLGVKILNDKFGIQTRGGCSCAGTYGHHLLHMSKPDSDQITCQITAGDNSGKPGWIRMSIHPTTTNQELDLILESILALASNHQDWSKDYSYDLNTNEFRHKDCCNKEMEIVNSWFDTSIFDGANKMAI